MATYHVNTGASAGGDGTTNNTTGATRAFNTLGVAQAALQTTLTENMTIECDGTSDASGAVFAAADWTTTGYTLTIKAHSNSVREKTLNTGKYYKQPPFAWGSGIRMTVDNVVLEGLQGYSTVANTTMFRTTLVPSRISDCIAKGDDSSSGQRGIGIGAAAAGADTAIANNNIIYDHVSDGLFKEGYSTNTVVVFYNNTSVNNGVGLDIDSGFDANSRVYNNLLTSNTTDYNEADTVSETDNNVTADATSPDTAHRSKTVTYAGGEDFSTDDTDVVGLGTDLSADSDYAFSADCIGEDRGSSFDIGAFQEPAGGNLAGTAAGVGGASGDLTGAGALSGTAAGVGGGSATLTGSGALSGQADGVATASANLVAAGALVGTADGVGGGSADLVAAGALTGTTDGVGGASGALTGDGALSGTADGVGGASGDLTALGSGAMSGTAGGTSGGSANLTGAGTLSGTSDGVSTASGLATGSGALSGQVDGVGGAGADLMGFGLLQGTAAGIATAFATPSGSGRLFGTAAGMSTAAAELLGSGALSGTAAGEGAASGDLTALDSGAMSGTAAGVSGGTGTLTGLGALTGTAAGVSGGGMAMPSVVQTQSQAQIIAAATAARIASVLAAREAFLRRSQFASSSRKRPPPGEFGKPMRNRNIFPIVELPSMGARQAASETLAAYLQCAKFRVYGGDVPDDFFTLNNVRAEWATPDENLDYPNASIVSPLTPAGGDNLVPFPLTETFGEFGDNTVLWKTGERMFDFQVDFWLNTPAERQAVEAALPVLFNPFEDSIGVVLGGHPRYFRRIVRATWINDHLIDDSATSFDRERRLLTTIRCDISEVVLRRAARLVPVLNPADLGG